MLKYRYKQGRFEVNKRWYDKNDKSDYVLESLRSLDELSQSKVAENVINIAGSIKAIKREKDELPISLGWERVMGLYQQNKNRRWYDRNSELSSAMQTISTLSDDEYLGIIEALSTALE